MEKTKIIMFMFFCFFYDQVFLHVKNDFVMFVEVLAKHLAAMLSNQISFLLLFDSK